MSMPLSRLIPGLSSAQVVSGIKIDCREIEPGDVFLALSGLTRHGLDYAGAALARGAAMVLFEPTLAGRPTPAEEPKASYIKVDFLSDLLGDIGARWYANPSREMNVIGVTGTNGKTSFVQLLSGALAHLGHQAGSIGTLGIGMAGAMLAQERTTPDALSVQAALRRLKNQGADCVAMEVSSHALDQGRVQGVRFHTAVFTNLTRDHLDYHQSMDAYAAAKAKLFDWRGLEHAIINVDDSFGAHLAQSLAPGVSVWRVGSTAAADVAITDLDLDPAGVRFALSGRFGQLKVRSQLIGRFNALNLAQVAVAMHVLGIANAQIESALAALKPINGRMNALSSAPLVVVDYAHTPDALEQALLATRGHAAGALWLVFGCGGDRDAGKRAQMAVVAERLADHVWVTSDNPRSEDPAQIVAEILAGFQRPQAVHVEYDRAQAIAGAIAAARAPDAVLIAGKGHETYQEIGGRRIPFDDAAHARSALDLRAC